MRLWKRLPNLAKNLLTEFRVEAQQNRIDKITSILVAKLTAFAPDLVHANDPDTLKSANTYFEIMGIPFIYDSHEDFDSLERIDPGWQLVMSMLEAKYIKNAKHVVTVSEEIASRLQEKYELKNSPYVILNTPNRITNNPSKDFLDVRSMVNVGDSAPLHIYIGSATYRRGLISFIDALKMLPTHSGVLLLPNSSYSRKLQKYIKKNHVQHRIWIQPYVAQEVLLNYISSATSGVSPLLHYPNHEVSCFTKFYEYLNSGIPVVSSDVRTMAKTILAENVGFVFPAGNVTELAKTLELVAEKSSLLKLAIPRIIGDRYTWESQESIIAEIYS